MESISSPELTGRLARALLASAPRALLDLEAELLFFPGQYILHYRDQENEQESYKLLTGAAIAAAFSGEPLDSGWIPPGVVRCGASTRGAFAVQFIPPGVHRLALQGDGPAPAVLLVPLPGLVLCGQDRIYRVWAVATATFDPAAPVYQAPLPNVFPDGAVCWGANQPPAATAAAIPAAWDLFIRSPFTNHLAGKKARRWPNDIRPLFEQLADTHETVFPADELLGYTTPGGRAATIADAVGEVIAP